MRRAGKSGKGITPFFGRRTDAFSTDFPVAGSAFKSAGKKYRKTRKNRIIVKAVLYLTRRYAAISPPQNGNETPLFDDLAKRVRSYGVSRFALLCI
ncbi:MAG: hypothetical protein HPY53_15585 [Brevinematales bacterium]|nr:hypothetical protein [Brevinematales bacterium]